MKPTRWILFSLGLLLAVACSQEAAQEEADPQARLTQQGERVYRGNCTACHHPDPSQPGTVGPAIAGSSLELLQAKVLRNEYPPGYTPKREGGGMIALPHLEPEIPALHAYLNSSE